MDIAARRPYLIFLPHDDSVRLDEMEEHRVLDPDTGTPLTRRYFLHWRVDDLNFDAGLVIDMMEEDEHEARSIARAVGTYELRARVFHQLTRHIRCGGEFPLRPAAGG